MSFSTTRPLRFGDCDPSGIAYFPSYLNILVGVIEEFFADCGAPWPALTAKDRIGTPTIRLDCTFKSPGLHGMEMEFRVHVRALGRTSLDLFHEVSHAGQLLWSAEQRLVATSLDTHKACPWPEPLRQALSARIETD